MKKLFNSRFLFILASSLIVLIVLTVGAFYLFDDEDDVFIKSGYVLNPLSSTSEKYFFDKDAGYKENLSSMIEFIDVDKNTVSVLKDSFLHYTDESLSFLKRGALLDLGSVKGGKAVSFYNISSESIIEKKDNSYAIASASGDIKLTNFIGRISDDKYIIVGDLSLKMPGNETVVKGNYFEVVYVEEGIVNIENKDVKFQVAAADTMISSGQHIKIDLGNKKIMYDKEDVMSITAITIDGDENIEIIPKVEEEEEDTPQGGGDGNGEGTGTGTGNGGGNGEGAGNDEGNNEGEITTPEDNIVINLKDAKLGSTDIEVIFEVLNVKETDNLKLQVINLASGRTVDIVASVVDGESIRVNLLTPNTKYLFSVVNEKNNTKYFQKVLETSGFGIKLEKEYATNHSLSYKITVDKDTDITNAKLALYMFNEETKQNEIVKTSYVDSVTGEVMYQEKVTYLSSLTGNIEGEHVVVYDELDSDTIYTAVLDEFSVASSNFKDIYNITLTSMTLKEIPTFNEMVVDKNVGTGSFDLSLSNIKDPDNAITNYTYLVYDKFTDKLAIDPIVHKNASPLNVKIGEGENKLKNDTNYYYKVIIEYYDNEKYIEYVTSDSIVFMMGDDPYVRVVPKTDEIKHDRIAATLYLIDNSCLISMPGRERCNAASSTVVEVSRINALTGERIPVYTKQVEFLVTDDEIKYDLYLEGLNPGTAYNIELRAKLNNSSSLETEEVLHTDDSKRTISTKYLSSFSVSWNNYTSSADYVVNVATRFFSISDANTLTTEESFNTMGRVVIKMYEGRNISELDSSNPIGEKEYTKRLGVNFKEMLYDNMYDISSTDTFGLSMKDLKCLNAPEDDIECEEGKLSEYYTIVIEAYTTTGYPITLVNNVYSYRINPILLMDGMVDPALRVNHIINTSLLDGKIFKNLTNGGTIVGYSVTSSFDKNLLASNNIIPKKVTYYVYNDKKKRLKFYILDENNELKLVDRVESILGDEGFDEVKLYMGYGTPYEIEDEIMSRGGIFYIGYDMMVEANGVLTQYPFKALEDSNAPNTGGIYKKEITEKETPNVKMYVSKSYEDSIVYKYEIKDPDLAIYKTSEDTDYAMLYSVNGQEGVKVPLTLVPDATYNHFSGEIKVDGLVKKDLYKIYYYINKTKTGTYANDVKLYLDNYSGGDRMFEGYYDSVNYNFKYEIINDPKKDNKVGIKILTNAEFIERIINYKLVFTAKYDDGNPVLAADGKVVKLEKELWELAVCPGESSDAIPRCLYVDYTELKNYGMKTEPGEAKKNISVTVTAFYDTGLTGYDYVVGSSEDADYKYCIMQDNTMQDSTTGEIVPGQYISFSSKGTSITVWSKKLNAPKGYYTYTLSGSLMELKSRVESIAALNNKVIGLPISFTSSGYSSKHGFVNPKMISIEDMELSGNETFYFDSITPKVNVTQKAKLINGSVLGLSLSGVDINELRYDDGYYVYVETWEKYEDVGDLSKTVRPEVKTEINSNNPLAEISAVIDGLKENTKYYHQVYVYIIQEGVYVYQQLFDAKNNTSNKAETYEYYTAKVSDLFKGVSVGVNALDEPYGGRELNSKINLYEYGNGISFNFDIIYLLCESGASCGLGEEDTYILKKTIPQSDVTKSMSDNVDISELKDLVYGKQYFMYIYTSADFYDENLNVVKRNVLINLFDSAVNIRKLTEPTFTATREAGVENNDYYIKFSVTANDPDRVLNNGEYFVDIFLGGDTSQSLLGDKDNCKVCLEVMSENGVYEKVSKDYAFDATIIEKQFRITGLEPDTKYTFRIYNDDLFINNADNVITLAEKTYTVYTTNNYGVAIGKDITYSITPKSIIVTFLGGSSFDNVVEVGYTIGVWDSDETATNSGSFVIGENNKNFEIDKTSSHWRFVIDPTGMKNKIGTTYLISISFKVKINDTDYITLTSAEVPGFEGKVIYAEDKN